MEFFFFIILSYEGSETRGKEGISRFKKEVKNSKWSRGYSKDHRHIDPNALAEKREKGLVTKRSTLLKVSKNPDVVPPGPIFSCCFYPRFGF